MRLMVYHIYWHLALTCINLLQMLFTTCKRFLVVYISCLFTGVHFPPRQWCIPLLEISHLFPKKIPASVENCPNFTLSQQNFLIFIRHNFWRPFLVIDRKFRIPAPYFPYFNTSPYFYQFPPDFVKFTCFLYTFCVFRFPLRRPWCMYAPHNARILDAPVSIIESNNHMDNLIATRNSLHRVYD